MRRNNRKQMLMEACETRRLMDATYHSLATSNLTQDWTNTSLISVADVWSGVPSIIGYQGNDPALALDNRNPSDIVSGTIGFSVDVIPNLTSVANTSGGVGEFEIANPVVALQGSAGADHPFLLFHLNTTGRQDILVTYNVRDIDVNDDTTQQVALQYRIGESGDFTNLPLGYIDDATTGGSATEVTPISVLLPAAAENQAMVQVRVMTANAPSNDEWVGIDDIVISSAPPGGAGTLGFSVASYEILENGAASITVNRVGGDNGQVQVDYDIVGGTAIAGTDYTNVSGTLTFADGDVTESFIIPLTNDSTPERNKTINIQLSNATNGALLDALLQAAVITLKDDDLTQSTGVLLNEIDVNPPGIDQPYEYVELKGPAGASLQGYYFIGIDGGAFDMGEPQRVIDLHDYSLGSNGLLLLRSASGFASEDAATTIVNNATFTSTNTLLDSTMTFLLIYSPEVILQSTVESLDEDGTDGTLELLPVDSDVADGIGWYATTSSTGRIFTDHAADLTVGPYNEVDPTPAKTHAASRKVGDTTANNRDSWFFGQLSNTSGNTSRQYDPAEGMTINLPTTTARLTPGAINFGPAQVTGKTYNVDAATPRMVITFNKNLSLAPLDDTSGSAFTLTNSTTSTNVPAASLTRTLSPANVATISFNSIPADGNYVLTINHANIDDVDGLSGTGTETLPFFFLQGDANQDRKVNTVDFNRLAGSFGASGKVFSDGDFNFSGTVDSTDFTLFAGQYGQALPAPAAPLSAAALFGAQTIQEDDTQLL